MFYMMMAPAPQPAPVAVSAPAPIETRAQGSLILQVKPGSAQVFVDNYYAGTADDFCDGQRSLSLDAGPHTVELDEPAHETVRFDVMASPNQPIVYRRDLTPVRPASSIAPIAPIVTGPIYIIPGCYAGNVLPKDANLPSTCDLSKATMLK